MMGVTQIVPGTTFVWFCVCWFSFVCFCLFVCFVLVWFGGLVWFGLVVWFALLDHRRREPRPAGWQLSFFYIRVQTRNFRRNFREKVRLKVDSS
jgi:hypothetical protein